MVTEINWEIFKKAEVEKTMNNILSELDAINVILYSPLKNSQKSINFGESCPDFPLRMIDELLLMGNVREIIKNIVFDTRYYLIHLINLSDGNFLFFLYDKEIPYGIVRKQSGYLLGLFKTPPNGGGNFPYTTSNETINEHSKNDMMAESTLVRIPTSAKNELIDQLMAEKGSDAESKNPAQLSSYKNREQYSLSGWN